LTKYSGNACPLRHVLTVSEVPSNKAGHDDKDTENKGMISPASLFVGQAKYHGKRSCLIYAIYVSDVKD
jgi:hypothetical protein